MDITQFEWDEGKNHENQKKHSVSFSYAQNVFFDPKRVIALDMKHSQKERRYFCIGRMETGILTVRFTYRGDKIRIIGAGYWRKGKIAYEKKNQIH